MKAVIITLALITTLVFGSFSMLTKLPLLKGYDYSQAVFSKQGELMRLTLAKDGQFRIFTPLNQISPQLQQATLLQEDRYFYDHIGFNPIALLKGFWVSYILRHRMQGGSTITMQLARLRYHLNTRSIGGKLIQIIYALRLESHYSKRQILEAYLNLAPYGGNIQGIGAASLIYFHTRPSDLTLAQSLSLTVIPQNPDKRTPHGSLPNQHLLAARQRLAERWRQNYGLSSLQKMSLNLASEFYQRSKLPFAAPHFVDYVLTRDHQAWIDSTLDLNWQQRLEQITHHYLTQSASRGINNAAVLLIDTDTMAIRAMLGSGDYWNVPLQGQNNGVLAQRSPGSTLKPFIYALAIEQGLITPKSVLYDVPMRFANYLPQNIDGQYMGPIPADQALVLSRNIPAVDLQARLKRRDLYQLLHQAGIPGLKNRSRYGLSIALGSAELRLLDLAKLYAILPNAGAYQSLRYRMTQPSPPKKTLLSPEASFMVLDMLTRHPPPNSLGTGAWVRPSLKVAWKTGTSSGNRDAWAFGLFDHYLLGVWLGNFSGDANPALVGETAAVPLMFQLIHTIASPISESTAFKPSADLNIKKVQICAISGMLPNRYCPKLTPSWFIPGVSPIQHDTLLRAVLIDTVSGLRACVHTPKTELRVYQFWPPQVRDYFLQRGIRKSLPPRWGPGCSAYQTETANELTILSPRDKEHYLLQEEKSAIPLQALSPDPNQILYWFIDDQYIAHAPASTVKPWAAKPGQHIIRVFDDTGAYREAKIWVQRPK